MKTFKIDSDSSIWWKLSLPFAQVGLTEGEQVEKKHTSFGGGNFSELRKWKLLHSGKVVGSVTECGSQKGYSLTLEVHDEAAIALLTQLGFPS
jgi:hypothetical protein